MAPIRTRFAPSPTGFLHLGNVRTALFAWLAARSSGGSFVLRIEDTDQGRYVPESEAAILETLHWLELNWDEGPEVDGPHGPYIQSLRLDLYAEHARRLVESGAAYWCTCAPERLAEMRAEQQRLHQPPRYDRRCLGRQDQVAAERASGMAAVLRLRMPAGTTEWDDVVHGLIRYDNADIDDQVLLKSDGFPTYHLAVVVDDHLMEISHVIRSDEWIPSTPKHLAIYAALGWEPPRFCHAPNVLDESPQKLSKRRGARTVLEYGEYGLPARGPGQCDGAPGGQRHGAGGLHPRGLIAAFTLDRVNPARRLRPARLDALNGSTSAGWTPGSWWRRSNSICGHEQRGASVAGAVLPRPDGHPGRCGRARRAPAPARARTRLVFPEEGGPRDRRGVSTPPTPRWKRAAWTTSRRCGCASPCCRGPRRQGSRWVPGPLHRHPRPPRRAPGVRRHGLYRQGEERGAPADGAAGAGGSRGDPPPAG